MLSCLPEYTNEDVCPKCGEDHTIMKALPERALTFTELQELTNGKAIDGIIPVVRIHDDSREGYYMKTVPIIVAIMGETVRTLWYNPETDDGWITVEKSTEEDIPFVLAKMIAQALRISAMSQDRIGGRKVVKNDDGLPEIDTEEIDRLAEIGAEHDLG